TTGPSGRVHRGAGQHEVAAEQINCPSVNESRGQMTAAAEQVTGGTSINHQRSAADAARRGQRRFRANVGVRACEMYASAVAMGTHRVSCDWAGIQEIAGLDINLPATHSISMA